MPKQTIGDLVDTSTVILDGTIQKLGESTMLEVPRADDIGIVSVNTVLEAAPVLGNLKGATITIRFSETQNTVGAKAIFFTNVWIYGSQIALSEVGRVETALERDVSSTIKSRPERLLAAHLAKADRVISGVVEKIDSEPPISEPISHHAPNWKRAILRVKSVHKGNIASDQLEVLFASSDDVNWMSSPKLKEGQEGIFILQRGRGRFLKPEMLTVLHPLDVHPPSASDRISSLIAKGGTQRKPN